MFLEKLRLTLQQILKEKHEKELLRPADLARRMNCSPQQVGYMLEGDRGLNDEWLLKFCAALEIAPTDLLRRAFGDAVFMGTVHQSRDPVPIQVAKTIRELKQRVDELNAGLEEPAKKETDIAG